MKALVIAQAGNAQCPMPNASRSVCRIAELSNCLLKSERIADHQLKTRGCQLARLPITL